MAVMQADLKLKGRQAFWETPRNLFLIIGTITAATAAIAGFTGYKIGQRPLPSAQPVQIIFQPGSIVAAPASVPPASPASGK